MNGHSASSVAQRYGVSQPDIAAISGLQEHAGPDSGGVGLQLGNRQSGTFSFATKSLSPDRPLSISADTGTSLLGARSEMGRMPGMEV
jgi:hypothetical protein